MLKSVAWDSQLEQVVPNEEGQLECPKCKKEYPLGTIENCPDDGSELAINFTAPDPLIGKTFAEKYEILTLLGEGGMCKVYKARHKFMKRIVAVKLLHESTMKDPQAKARFQKEAEAASALNHHNVVTVHDFGFTPSGQAFFVMDCLEGKTLEEIIEYTAATGEKLTLPRAIDLFAQACDGLDHAHRKGIVHRDIKPSNLVVIKQEDGSDVVKIVDFGIAKVLSSPEGEKNQQQLTQAGEIFGTPAYMSPEQCNGQALDGRSDLYSFACLMYETLAGTPPHVGDTFINTIVKHINDKPKSFTETAPSANVPIHIESVVLKCLEKDPKDRYASAVELKQALFDAAYASGVQGMRFGAVPEPRSTGQNASVGNSQAMTLSELKVTRGWRLTIIAILSSLAVVIAGAAGFIFFYPGPKGDVGTPFDKFMFSTHMANADDLYADGKYSDAIKELEMAKELALRFGDGKGRLKNTLEKMGETYGKAREYSKQETVNKEIAAISNEEVFKEFEDLMALLTKWEQPTQSHTAVQERTLQAAAFADRIENCSLKLNISRERQEKLLLKAIKVFDSMESKDWVSQVNFRRMLGECYRTQQRFKLEDKVLREALLMAPREANNREGWAVKAKTTLLLGQLQRNLATSKTQLDEARSTLEDSLKLVRSHLSDDKELLRDNLNSLEAVCRLYHTKEYDVKADAIEKEANSIELNLDAHPEGAENPKE
ncbi:MAG: protein kinase [Candidatus Obscuribacterales bacterium]|nr:protein kinase [Candidatus Obscuribacterales bacterium]